MNRRALMAISFVAVFWTSACASGPVSAESAQSPAASAAASTSPLASVQIRTEVLASGVKVILAKMPRKEGQEQRAYIGSYVAFGTMDETVPGEAHLIEHVVANSPSAVPAPPKAANAKVFEGNALTKPNYTSYLVIASPSDLARLIHGRLAKFGRIKDDPQIFEEQVERVVAELERNRANEYLAYKALHAMARDQSPRLTDEIAWTKAVEEADVRRTIARVYQPAKGVVVVAGDIDLEQTAKIVLAAEERLDLAELRDRPISANATAPLATGSSAVVTGQNSGAADIAGLAWPQPRHGSPDFIPFLIVDQLLLGGRTDVTKVDRSDGAPLPMLLHERIGATNVGDGRDATWGAPPFADLGPSLFVVQFNSKRSLEPEEVIAATISSLRQIRKSLTDEQIEAATHHLAAFYESWFFEPTFRILADHLAAHAIAGTNPEQVKMLPAQIRSVTPEQVKQAFDRYLLERPPFAVVLPPA